MLLQIGNVFGAVVVIATGGLLFLVIRYGSRDVQTLFAYTWTWFLLVGGFRHVLEFRRIRPRGGKDSDSDAAVLRKMTFLPAPLWVGFFWIATFAALLYGGGILLGMLKLGR
ncbi:MAG: hypothetical protein AUI14_06100 [Actinobacteria bacterium 13_2_20CM_2_71_6]|nr:MAG: hypothetical protein AUI14_06100 [Actinobacteria bacterium 13_2_20CM_2_71_6]